jgi:hypothetical protein
MTPPDDDEALFLTAVTTIARTLYAALPSDAYAVATIVFMGYADDTERKLRWEVGVQSKGTLLTDADHELEYEDLLHEAAHSALNDLNMCHGDEDDSHDSHRRH